MDDLNRRDLLRLELLHAEGGYLHDLRGLKFSGEGLWRRPWATKIDGNFYPIHGLGPVANCLDGRWKSTPPLDIIHM